MGRPHYSNFTTEILNFSSKVKIFIKNLSFCFQISIFNIILGSYKSKIAMTKHLKNKILRKMWNWPFRVFINDETKRPTRLKLKWLVSNFFLGNMKFSRKCRRHLKLTKVWQNYWFKKKPFPSIILVNFACPMLFFENNPFRTKISENHFKIWILFGIKFKTNTRIHLGWTKNYQVYKTLIISIWRILKIFPKYLILQNEHPPPLRSIFE